MISQNQVYIVSFTQPVQHFNSAIVIAVYNITQNIKYIHFPKFSFAQKLLKFFQWIPVQIRDYINHKVFPSSW